MDFSEATFVYDGNGSMVKSTVNEITTYYIGGYYELKIDGTTETETKYYSGPTGRFAEALLCNAFAEFERSSNSMRATAILEFSQSENSPLTGASRSFDHLQSSSVILSEVGWLVSRTDYTAFGEVRAESGTSPTDYTYTGQRSYTDDFGLMFYNARWYDPDPKQSFGFKRICFANSPGQGTESLRQRIFAQADSIIPQPGNSGDWNRYAYVNYNPINFNDPTGHWPNTPPIFPIDPSIPYIVDAVLAFFGMGPDTWGLDIAQQYVPKDTDVNGVDSILVAAGIAVQSQWYRSITDTRDGLLYNGTSSGIGYAQVSDSQMIEYGLKGLDQEDPDVAVLAMAERINSVWAVCDQYQCSAEDMFIAAAMAQNGTGFKYLHFESIMGNSAVTWNSHIDSRTSTGSPIAKFRQAVTGLQYDTQFILKLFINDVRSLHSLGYGLPLGLSLSDINNIERKYIDEHKWNPQ